MEQIIKQNMFSRTLFNESKLGAYYTDPVHAAKIGRLFRLQGECCVLEPSFGNAEALKVFLSQCERADEAGSVHTFGVELNRETFEQYKQEIEFPVCADFIGGIRASNRAFTLCFANPPYGVGGDDGSTRLEKLFVERIYQLMKTKGYLVLVVSLTTMNLDEFAKCLLARFKPVAFYRFDDKEFEKYKQVVFIGQKRVSIGLYRKEYEEWMIANPGHRLWIYRIFQKTLPHAWKFQCRWRVRLNCSPRRNSMRQFYFIIRVPWCQCLKSSADQCIPVGRTRKADSPTEKGSAVFISNCWRRTGSGWK